MNNITITLDEETARWARIGAAKRCTRVSRLVGQMLEERREQESERRSVLGRFMARLPTALKDAGAACPSREHRYDRLDFFDTNVLVYARDASEPRNEELAVEWIRTLWTRASGRLSFQVL